MERRPLASAEWPLTIQDLVLATETRCLAYDYTRRQQLPPRPLWLRLLGASFGTVLFAYFILFVAILAVAALEALSKW